MKIFDWQDIPMIGKNVYDVFDELFYRSEKAGMYGKCHYVGGKIESVKIG